MLLLEPDAMWRTHEASGAKFKLRAIDAPAHDAMKEKATSKDGRFQYVVFAGLFAVAAIADWEGVGVKQSGEVAPANEDNVRKFGRSQALNIMPWIVEQSSSVGAFLEEEKAAAKND